MPQTFTSPSGATYVWDKEQPPTQADIDAIIAHDAEVNGKSAPSSPPADPTTRTGGASGTWEDAPARPALDNSLLTALAGGAGGDMMSTEFGGDVGAVPGPRTMEEAAAQAQASRGAMGTAARLAPLAVAPFTGGMSLLPYMATMGTAGALGNIAGNAIEGKPQTAGDAAESFVLASTPIPKIIPGGNVFLNAVRGGGTAMGTVAAGNYAKKAIDERSIAPFSDYKEAFKGAMLPAIIGAATMGLSGKLGNAAAIQEEADAGKAAMAELGITNPVLGDVLPKKYGALQQKVATTTPEIAAKIAQARSPLAKAFYGQIGDVPMNETIATELSPIMAKMDQADAAYAAATAKLAKVTDTLEKAKADAQLMPAQMAQIHKGAVIEQMAALSEQAKAQIQQQVLADTVMTQTGKAEGLRNVVKTLFGVRSEGASVLMKETGIDPNAAIFRRDLLVNAAKEALGGDANTIAGKSIINTLENWGNKTGRDAVVAQAEAVKSKLRAAAASGRVLTPEESRAIFGKSKAQSFDASGRPIPDAASGADIAYLSLDDFKNLRNGISDGFASKVDTNGMTNAERLASKVYAAMGNSHVSQIEQTYGPESAQAYLRFQKFWRNTSQLRDSDFGRALLRGEISDAAIGGMAGLLAKGNVDEIKNFRQFVDIIRPQNRIVADNAMAAMGSAVRNSMLQQATDAGTVNYRKLGDIVKSAVSKPDFPFPIDQFRLGNRETIDGWTKALQDFKASDLTPENIRTVMESPQIQAALSVGGKDIGPRITTLLAEKAFYKRVLDAEALKSAGLLAPAKQALAEASVHARQAGVESDAALAAMRDAENNPLTSVFRGKSGYSLTNEADNMGASNSITGLVDGMKRAEGRQFITALRDQKPDLADMVERRLLANEFASFAKQETRVPGEIIGIDPQKIRAYFEPAANNADSRLGKLTAILGEEKMAAFKKFAQGIAKMNEDQRAAIVAAKISHPGIEAAGLGRMVATGSTQSGRSLMNVIKLAGDAYDRKKYNLLSAMVLDNGFLNAMSRAQGKIGDALASIPAQKAFLLLNDKRMAGELDPPKKAGAISPDQPPPAPPVVPPPAPKPVSQFREGALYRDPTTGNVRRYSGGQFAAT